MDFRSRKDQIEKDFLRRLVQDLKRLGCPVTRRGRELIKTELRDAAMVGAAEERSRDLRLIRQRGLFAADEIVKQPVLAVLGYEE